MPALARDHLVSALKADLVGPYVPESEPGGGQEVLRLPPLRWYLTGFLVPEGGAGTPASLGGDEDEELDAGDDISGPTEGAATEPAAKQPSILPSSLGMSVLLPDAVAGTADLVELVLSYGEYKLRKTKDEVVALCEARGMDAESYLPKAPGKPPKPLWERIVVPPKSVSLDLEKARLGQLHQKELGNGLCLEYRVEAIEAKHAAQLRLCEQGQGARALSVFLVNTRPVASDPERETKQYVAELNEATIFQAEMELRYAGGLLPRADVHFSQSRDFDDQMIDLQFRHELEWAVGHGIATRPIARDPKHKLDGKNNPAVAAVTNWIPQTTVARVQAASIDAVEVGMEALAKLESATDIAAALGALPSAYEAWIEGQAAVALDDAQHRETQATLVERAGLAKRRIEDGIALLQSDAQLRLAFQLMNRAMAAAARKQRPQAPQWRLFQLAFVLLNLRGLCDPSHEDRERVELLFFPTGGGKTEAYLGVIATTLLLRRLRGQGRPDAGLGVAVILRYTLRLLTLDQLERAAALICSLELLRRASPKTLGSQRFSIGLWVGRSGAPNTMADAQKLIDAYRMQTAESRGSPFPLAICPWCKTAIERRNMEVLPRGKNPTHTRVVCANRDCEFSAAGGREMSQVRGIPVVFVDDQIYRELPAFVVSTVDKFAMLTHRGPAGKLFGRVHSYSDQSGAARVFWSGGDGYLEAPKGAALLPEGLLPPELIVQDELHLISGPLGTMVGLFETLIEELCKTKSAEGREQKPKILAATATVRRASAQIQALYGRRAEATALFPPQGVDAWETFFATRDHNANERMYIGLAAAGRSMKRILLQSYLALLGAGQWLTKRKEDNAGEAADPYRTVVGYFNSLRELGGMRRLVDDEIYMRIRKLGERAPEDLARPRSHRWLASRQIGDPIELTSRVSTTQIVQDKNRLDTEFFKYEAAKKEAGREYSGPKPVDVALASNMISVGLDITRLGLMVMAGQPKTTSEYIQASSRVGRDDKRPGLVVTVYNLHKPRDRSHYEHFIAYHESFYRYVEAQSVTPFSLPALDRGLASVLVAMVRHLGGAGAAAPKGASNPDFVKHNQAVVAEILARRSAAQPGASTQAVDAQLRARCMRILDNWRRVLRAAEEGRGSAQSMCYSPYERKAAGSTLALLRTPEDDAKRQPSDRIAPHDPLYPFVAPTSLRDVEASTPVWIHRGYRGAPGER